MEMAKESTSCIPSEKNSLLITEVRKFPSLYDTSDPNYYVLAERNKAWLKVAANCAEPADLCHSRWKSLRKRYAKEKRRFHEILQGRRRPWALFPKMAFLKPPTSTKRIRPAKSRRNVHTNPVSTDGFKQEASDDDMLIVDDNDEIVRTCKSVEMSEEDEYIYETLDDPDSALEIMKGGPSSKVKPTAIRSGGAVRIPIPARPTSSGRIRRLTPKMQNSIIAKKLKQAQQILQQSNVPSNNSTTKKTTALQKIMNANKKIPVENKTIQGKTVLYQDRTTRHVATVNPNIIRIEKITEKDHYPQETQSGMASLSNEKESPSTSPEGSRQFKVFKLKGRNPIIFSPDRLPDIQSFLKSEAAANQDSDEIKAPVIKVKSVDNLNNQSTSSASNYMGENNNLDIIHSVGLMRKGTAEKSTEIDNLPHQSYSRAYSWNRPTTKVTNKQITERIQPDSQTKDYEIEETWNDIKEENIENDEMWAHPPPETEMFYRPNEAVTMHNPETVNKSNIWNRVNEAKLELITYQRKLLEEQHKKNLEYLKKEHELKMTLLKAEIDLKRKQLNIML